MSPTARSVKMLRAEGWLVANVEKTIPHCFIKQDLFGFGDALAVRGNEVVIIQVTGDNGGNVMARFHKMKLLPTLWTWLEAETRRVEIHGWGRRGAAGKRKLWRCRIIDVTMQSDANGTRTPVASERHP
jgi:hypothetical protein